MAGIQFINTNPAIDQFNAQVQRGDQARRLEEQDFRQRFQLEQAMGADKARRAGAAAYFATPQATQTPAPPIAQFQATPQPQPIASAPAAPLPPQTEPSPFGEDPRLPAAVSAPAAPTATPPAISAVTAQPAAARAPAVRAAQDDRFSRMAGTMAKTPGTGADLLHLVTADATSRRSAAVEERKMHLEGIKGFREAANHGDLVSMRVINQEYKLGIPEAAMRDRQTAVTLATGINLAGKLDDERAAHFMMAYTEAVKSGADQVTAMAAGSKAAQGVQVAPKKTGSPFHFTAADNTIHVVDPNERIARPIQGPKAKPSQPPFNITPGGIDAREQAGRMQDEDNARQSFGSSRAYERASEQERNKRIKAYHDYRMYGTPLPTFARGAKAETAPAAAPAKRLKFDAQGNQVQ